jgi:succinate dehydrogenase / fumarate reductase cytochrome b subunit
VKAISTHEPEDNYKMSAFVNEIREGVRYKGGVGQWTWLLHRLTGLGVLFFLVLHVPGEALAAFNPAMHEAVTNVYKTPVFAVLELGLAACLVIHSINGTRVALLELKPEWWTKQGQAMKWSIIITLIVLTPTVLVMAGRSFMHFFGGK